MITYRTNIFALSLIIFTTAQAMNGTLETQMVHVSSPFSEICEQSAFFEALKSMPKDRDDLFEELPRSTKLYYELFTELEPKFIRRALDSSVGTETPTESASLQELFDARPEAWAKDIDAANTLFEAIQQSTTQTHTPVKAVRYLTLRLKAMDNLIHRTLDLAWSPLYAIIEKMLDYAHVLETQKDTSLQNLATFIRQQLPKPV